MLPTVLRPLGQLERWFAVRHTLGHHHSVSLHFTLLPTSPSLSPAAVFVALTQCIGTYAALGVAIVDDEAFVRVPCIRLWEVVSFVEEEPELEAVLEQEAATGFAAGTVGWRFRILGKRTAVFSWHHAMLDGESGVMVLQTFVGSLPTSPSPHIPEEIITPPAIPLPAPIELLLPSLHVSWSRLLQKAINTFFPVFFSVGWWTGPKIALKTAGRTRVMVVTLPPGLRERCREEATSVTALIHAATATAILEGLPKVGLKGVEGSLAVSLRRFLPEGAARVGVMAASLVLPHPHLGFPDGVWERARWVKRAINEGLKSKEWNIALLAYAPRDLAGHLERSEGGRREKGFGLSNLGVVRGAGEVVFSQSAGIAGSPIEIGVVGEKVAIVWLEGVVGVEWVEEVVERLRGVLVEAVAV